ncbi:MAG: flippase [Flavisolibacter sp.]|nr:flippase [Flavisolibacter sp.]
MRSLKQNFIYNFLLTASNLLFPLITFPYAARVLGPEGIGTANFVQNFCQYFILIAALGIPMYGNREVAKLRDNLNERSKVFYEIISLKVITTLIVLIPYFFIVHFVDKFAPYKILYYWGAVYILIDILSFEWFFKGLENFRYITLRSLVVKVASIISLFLFVKSKSDLTIYFLIIVVTPLINGLINVRFASRFLQFKFRFKELNLKRHMVPLLLIFGYYLGLSIYTMLDTVMIGFIATNIAVGYYVSAMKLNRIALMVNASLGEVLVPRLTNEVANKNFDEVKRLLHQSLNFVFTFTIPMMAGIYILAPEIVLLFSGVEFLPSIPTMRILCALILIVGIANVFVTQVLIPLSKDKILLLLSILGGVISIILNFILIPFLEEKGAAITIIITEAIITATSFWFARKLIIIPFPIKVFLLNIISVLPYFFIANYIRLFTGNPLIIILFTAIASISVFLIVQTYVFKNTILTGFIADKRIQLKKLVSYTLKFQLKSAAK